MGARHPAYQPRTLHDGSPAPTRPTLPGGARKRGPAVTSLDPQARLPALSEQRPRFDAADTAPREEIEAERYAGAVVPNTEPADRGWSGPASSLQRPLGVGARLTPEDRARHGAALGVDLSDVRVHTDPQAVDAARRSGARAWTEGRDVVLADAPYPTRTAADQRLLAHELWHVADARPGVHAAGFGDVHAAEERDRQTALAAPYGSFLDNFQEARYDLSYGAKGGNLSTIVRLVYRDGVAIDLDIYQVQDTLPPPDQISAAMRIPYLGDGGRVFPALLNRGTTPRLWEVKQVVLQTMDEYNVEFMTLAVGGIMPVIIGVATAPMQMGPAGGTSRLRTTRTRGLGTGAVPQAVFDAEKISEELMTAASAGGAVGNRGRFLAALKLLSQRGLTQTQNHEVVKKLLSRVGFGMQAPVREGTTLVLVSEDGVARLSLFANGGLKLEVFDIMAKVWVTRW